MSKLPPFFPRGDGPLVSILIPTRGRVDDLEKAIGSCVNFANSSSNLEFLLRIDDDDTETIEFACKMELLCPWIKLRKIVGPRGNGYEDLHLYHHQLASIAKGDWLLLYNDDARIRTKNWDTILDECIPSPCYIGIDKVCMTGFVDGFSFFFLRNGTHKFFGHLGHHCLYDDWMHSVFKMGALLLQTPIRIEHDLKEAKSIRVLTNEQRRLKIQDCEKLLDFLEEEENKAYYSKIPEYEGWYIWKNKGVCRPVFIYPNGSWGTIIPDDNIGKVEARWYPFPCQYKTT